MSQKLKLNTEVEKLLKAIQERAEEFDGSWDSLQVAETQKSREKYEEEVNREIKKLQRMREQVRCWIAGGIVKEDEPLQKARRDVETRMEKLREYEREAKTKLYSRAGLASDKIDPVEKARREARSWLGESISKLNCQIEQHESELDVMEGANNRKKLDKDKLEKMEFLDKTLKSHQFHLGKFETILRMLDNETLASELVFGLKDEFEYYLENASNGMLSDIDHITYTGIEFDAEPVEEAKTSKSGDQLPVTAADASLDVSCRSESMEMVLGDSPTSVKSMAASDVSSVATTTTSSSRSSVMSAAVPPKSRLPKQSKATSKIFLHHTKTEAAHQHHAALFGARASGQAGHKPTAGRMIKRTNSKKLAVGKDNNSPTKASTSSNMVALPLAPGEIGLPRPSELPTRRRSFAELVSQPITRGTTATSRSKPPVLRATAHAPLSGSMPPPKAPEVKILQAPKRIWNAWEDRVEKESDQAMQVDKVASPTPTAVTPAQQTTPTSAASSTSSHSLPDKEKPRTIYVTPPSSSYMDTTEPLADRSPKERSQMTDYQIKLSLQKQPDPVPARQPFSTFKEIAPKPAPLLLPKEPTSLEKTPTNVVPRLTTPTPSSSSSSSGVTGGWKVPAVPSMPVLGSMATGWPSLQLAWPLATGTPASLMAETAVINTMRSAALANLPATNHGKFEAPLTWMSSYMDTVPPANEFFGSVGQKYVFTNTTPSPATITFAGPPTPTPSPTSVFESHVRFRLTTDVLFYLFYFDKDTQLRANAAKDLEGRNWSFHTKLNVWMQRMDFPKVQTESYERGNFRYWDRDSWREEQLYDFLVEYGYVKNLSEELSAKAKA